MARMKIKKIIITKAGIGFVVGKVFRWRPFQGAV